MYTVAISPELRKYLEARGVHLDAPLDECPETEEMFCPSAEDEADYRAWCAEVDTRNRDIEDMHRESQYQDLIEREQYERELCAWVIRPV